MLPAPTHRLITPTTMNSKPFHGRAIYQPSGAAAEYSQWACNLFNGCPNRCDYCYNRHSMTAKVLGADEVTMKRQLLDVPKHDKHGREQNDWHDVVYSEIKENLDAIIRDGGLFFSFVSDPLLKSTWYATYSVVNMCDCFYGKNVPITILTKSAWWHGTGALLDREAHYIRRMLQNHKSTIFLGFTLTGMEYMERHCISNTNERIEAMAWAHDQGIYTWASIEPVIDYQMALDVITRSLPYCREYRIGLASKLGIKYDTADVRRFMECVSRTIGDNAKIIWKKSVLDKIK